jgi:hypothetical protein
VADETGRPGLPVGAWIVAAVILLIAGWIVLGFVFAAARAAIALLGYVVVAVVAYYVGKAVGRSSGPG